METRWMNRRNETTGENERFYPVTHKDAVVGIDDMETSLNTLQEEILVTKADVEELQSNLDKTDTARKAIADQYGYQIDKFYSSLTPIGGLYIGPNSNLESLDYIKVGRYYCPYNDNAITLINCPTTVAFMMEVYSPLHNIDDVDNELNGTWIYRVRKLIDITGSEYIQVVNSGSNAGEFYYNTWNRTIGHTILYNELNKYLPLTGGTLNDTLRVKINGYYTELHQYNKDAYIRTTDGSGNNYADFAFGRDMQPIYTTVKDGVYSSYRMYGEHNITCGTTALTAGSSSLATNCIYLQYE